MTTATQGIDFATLSLQDALDLACFIEEEAKDRYVEFAESLELHHTGEAATFFRFMAANEEKHRAELAARRAQLFGEAPRRVNRGMLFDVEAPDYDEARASMTVRDALKAALRSEVKAYAFFLQAMPRLGDASVKKLFEELCAEEVLHQNLVERELAKAPPDPLIPAAEFEDAPVNQ